MLVLLQCVLFRQSRVTPDPEMTATRTKRMKVHLCSTSPQNTSAAPPIITTTTAAVVITITTTAIATVVYRFHSRAIDQNVHRPSRTRMQSTTVGERMLIIRYVLRRQWYQHWDHSGDTLVSTMWYTYVIGRLAMDLF